MGNKNAKKSSADQADRLADADARAVDGAAARARTPAFAVALHAICLCICTAPAASAPLHRCLRRAHATTCRRSHARRAPGVHAMLRSNPSLDFLIPRACPHRAPEKANCELLYDRSSRNTMRAGNMSKHALVTTVDVPRDDELTWNYGASFGPRDYPNRYKNWSRASPNPPNPAAPPRRATSRATPTPPHPPHAPLPADRQRRNQTIATWGEEPPRRQLTSPATGRLQ